MANSTTTQKLCNWFIQQSNARGHVLTPVKLNHLVILADWWHLHRTGGFLINERVEAWPSGPVLPSIYHEYKDQPPYSSIEHPSRRQPPLEEETDIIPFLEHIWNVYGKYTAQQLGRINTAPSSPWRTASKSQRNMCRRTFKAWPDNSGKNSLPLPCTAFFQSKHIFE